MNKNEAEKLCFSLWDDIENKKLIPSTLPLLAHYTSIEVLEQMLINNEIWFSNPLFMNDYEEMSFGVIEGESALRRHEGIYDALSENQYFIFMNYFEYYADEFSNKESFDIYALCMTEHSEGDSDGLLSMWRGYGGNGTGAAIVFDLSKMNARENSPLIIDKVTYASKQERLDWINNKLDEITVILKNNTFLDEQLYILAYHFFERLKIFALFTKHHGFKEENEWRFIYMKSRDMDETFVHMLNYSIGINGVEPKLKFLLKPIDGVTKEDVSFESYVHNIILGPSQSSPIAKKSIERMLHNIGRNDLADKLIASTTPYRA